MKKAHLIPCPSCARHVRASETACPFCRGALAATAARPAPRAPAPTSRLSRAAMYAFGAGTITLASACSTTNPDEGRDGGTDAQYMVDAAYGGPPDAMPVPLYGGPPIDAGHDAPPLVDAAYGGPPIDAQSDAPSDGPPMVDAAYGGPPIDSGHD
jgi:hypothetical protein